MRAVLDTNVIVSAVLVSGGNERRILDAWRLGAFDLVVSPALLEELARVLAYPKIRSARWITDAEVEELVETLAEGSIVVAGTGRERASRDPGDDMVITAAFEGRADWLVTGDRNLLVLESYRRIRIVRPAEFVRILARQSR